MSDWQTRSFWLGHKAYTPGQHLDGDETADVVVMGGGFTGLWSAILLKEADPSLDVTVLEGKVVGYGASGRNGGFAMTMVARNLHDLRRKVGDTRARATHLAMVDTLREIEEFAAKEGIDCDLTNPGVLTVSNGPEQDDRIRQDVAAADALGLTDFHELTGAECREMVDSPRIRCGHYEDDSLLVDPAALSRGLKDAAIRRGVRVYENTPVDEVESVKGARVEARTPYGRVHADRGLVAMNAYANTIPALARWIFTIYAYVVVTEPLSGEQWARVGWERRMGVEDKRIMPHFHRPTADGRILWGGRDAPFKATGPNPRWDRDPHIFARLEESFRWNFPLLDDVPIADAWAGPVCGTVNCFSSVGWIEGERLAYALGYAGHGVGPSQLNAKIVRDLMLNRQSDLLDLPMVTRKPVRLPPGPLRRWMLDSSQNVLLRADDTGGGDDWKTRLALKFLQ